MACFADVNVSQRRVATYARCGGSFDIHLAANFSKESSGEKNRKSVNIWQKYGNGSVAQLFWPTLYTPIHH